ncbi:Polysaccharide deacetylase [Saccharicrinis carchari]|uniref:Polysaccharide deacetylase n=1 Tax=Saccharicrinis carchari TaxID=1168039 RepID=A0A521BR95_SACCC|nr:polysaccharide deacetylase family protein [Saccharicrinis carchari]SMO49688.1 Polysaccharide deacetylase [Saccharicrinis carchari]
MANRDLLVLNYHSIMGVDSDPLINKNIYRTEKELEQDILFLKNEYHFVSLSDITEHKLNGKKLPPHSVFLTFDDGLAVNYRKIRPILLKHNIPAAFFINPFFVDNKDLHYQRKKNLIACTVLPDEVDRERGLWISLFKKYGINADNFHDALSAVGYNNSNILDELASLFNVNIEQYLNEHQVYLTSQQIEQMISEGFWFGGHSMDHPKYDDITLQEQINQTMHSVDWVKNRFGLRYSIFAFPSRDHKVSMQLFEEIKPKTELTFGVIGMGHDIIQSHVQRIGVESSGVPIRVALKLEYLKYVVHSYLGRKVYIRSGEVKHRYITTLNVRRA